MNLVMPYVVMLVYVMLNVVMLSFVMPAVIMQSVVAPLVLSTKVSIQSNYLSSSLKMGPKKLDCLSLTRFSG